MFEVVVLDAPPSIISVFDNELRFNKRENESVSIFYCM